jgi:hypothetical protein
MGHFYAAAVDGLAYAPHEAVAAADGLTFLHYSLRLTAVTHRVGRRPRRIIASAPYTIRKLSSFR